jgi:hypothetical protein
VSLSKRLVGTELDFLVQKREPNQIHPIRRTSRDRWVSRLSFRRGGRFWHVERPGGLTVIDRLWAEISAEGAG